MLRAAEWDGCPVGPSQAHLLGKCRLGFVREVVRHDVPWPYEHLSDVASTMPIEREGVDAVRAIKFGDQAQYGVRTRSSSS